MVMDNSYSESSSDTDESDNLYDISINENSQDNLEDAINVKASGKEIDDFDLFEEVIVNKEKEKADQIVHNLTEKLNKVELDFKKCQEENVKLKTDNATLMRNISSLWYTASKEGTKNRNEILKLTKENESLKFRKGIQQLSKDDLDQAISRIAAYDKAEFKSFMKEFQDKNFRFKCKETKASEVPIRPKIDFLAVARGTRIHASKSSESFHLQKLLGPKSHSVTSHVIENFDKLQHRGSQIRKLKVTHLSKAGKNTKPLLRDRNANYNQHIRDRDKKHRIESTHKLQSKSLCNDSIRKKRISKRETQSRDKRKRESKNESSCEKEIDLRKGAIKKDTDNEEIKCEVTKNGEVPKTEKVKRATVFSEYFDQCILIDMEIIDNQDIVVSSEGKLILEEETHCVLKKIESNKKGNSDEEVGAREDQISDDLISQVSKNSEVDQEIQEAKSDKLNASFEHSDECNMENNVDNIRVIDSFESTEERCQESEGITSKIESKKVTNEPEVSLSERYAMLGDNCFTNCVDKTAVNVEDSTLCLIQSNINCDVFDNLQKMQPTKNAHSVNVNDPCVEQDNLTELVDYKDCNKKGLKESNLEISKEPFKKRFKDFKPEETKDFVSNKDLRTYKIPRKTIKERRTEAESYTASKSGIPLCKEPGLLETVDNLNKYRTVKSERYSNKGKENIRSSKSSKDNGNEEQHKTYDKFVSSHHRPDKLFPSIKERSRMHTKEKVRSKSRSDSKSRSNSRHSDSRKACDYSPTEQIRVRDSSRKSQDLGTGKHFQEIVSPTHAIRSSYPNKRSHNEYRYLKKRSRWRHHTPVSDRATDSKEKNRHGSKRNRFPKTRSRNSSDRVRNQERYKEKHSSPQHRRDCDRNRRSHSQKGLTSPHRGNIIAVKANVEKGVSSNENKRSSSQKGKDGESRRYSDRISSLTPDRLDSLQKECNRERRSHSDNKNKDEFQRVNNRERKYLQKCGSPNVRNLSSKENIKVTSELEGSVGAKLVPKYVERDQKNLFASPISSEKLESNLDCFNYDEIKDINRDTNETTGLVLKLRQNRLRNGCYVSNSRLSCTNIYKRRRQILEMRSDLRKHSTKGSLKAVQQYSPLKKSRILSSINDLNEPSKQLTSEIESQRTEQKEDGEISCDDDKHEVDVINIKSKDSPLPQLESRKCSASNDTCFTKGIKAQLISSIRASQFADSALAKTNCNFEEENMINKQHLLLYKEDGKPVENEISHKLLSNLSNESGSFEKKEAAKKNLSFDACKYSGDSTGELHSNLTKEKRSLKKDNYTTKSSNRTLVDSLALSRSVQTDNVRKRNEFSSEESVTNKKYVKNIIADTAKIKLNSNLASPMKKITLESYTVVEKKPVMKVNEKDSRISSTSALSSQRNNEIHQPLKKRRYQSAALSPAKHFDEEEGQNNLSKYVNSRDQDKSHFFTSKDKSGFQEEDTIDQILKKNIVDSSHSDDSETSLLQYLGHKESPEKTLLSFSPPPFVLPPPMPSSVSPVSSPTIDTADCLLKPTVSFGIDFLKDIIKNASKSNVDASSSHSEIPQYVSSVLPSLPVVLEVNTTEQLRSPLTKVQITAQLDTPSPKTLTTSSCSPIPVATPLNKCAESAASTPPSVNSLLKSSTPIVAFDLNRKSKFPRESLPILAQKIISERNQYRPSEGSSCNAISDRPIAGDQQEVSLPYRILNPKSNKDDLELSSGSKSNSNDLIEKDICKRPSSKFPLSTVTTTDNCDISQIYKESISSSEFTGDLKKQELATNTSLNSSVIRKKVPFTTLSSKVSRSNSPNFYDFGCRNKEESWCVSSFSRKVDDIEDSILGVSKQMNMEHPSSAVHSEVGHSKLCTENYLEGGHDESSNCDSSSSSSCSDSSSSSSSSTTSSSSCCSTCSSRPNSTNHSHIHSFANCLKSSSSPLKNSSSPLKNSSSPQKNSCSPQKNSCLPQKNSCLPQKNSCSPQKNSCLPQKNSCSPQKNARLSQKNSSLPQKKLGLPQKNSNSPPQILSSPHHISSSPNQISSSPHQISSSPHQISSSPHHVSSSPHHVSSSPYHISSSPTQKSSSAPQNSVSPSKKSHSSIKRSLKKVGLKLGSSCQNNLKASPNELLNLQEVQKADKEIITRNLSKDYEINKSMLVDSKCKVTPTSELNVEGNANVNNPTSKGSPVHSKTGPNFLNVLKENTSSKIEKVFCKSGTRLNQVLSPIDLVVLNCDATSKLQALILPTSNCVPPENKLNKEGSSNFGSSIESKIFKVRRQRKITTPTGVLTVPARSARNLGMSPSVKVISVCHEETEGLKLRKVGKRRTSDTDCYENESEDVYRKENNLNIGSSLHRTDINLSSPSIEPLSKNLPKESSSSVLKKNDSSQADGTSLSNFQKLVYIPKKSKRRKVVLSAS